MKKLLILVIALALVGGVAMAQVTVGGEVEARIQREMDGGGTHSQTFARVTVSANVDQYNRAFIRIDQTRNWDADATPAATAAGAPVVNRAHITTDLGALLDTDAAGIGISWNTGLNEFGYADVAQIDAYEWSGLYVAKPWGTGTKLAFNIMDMFNLHAAVLLDGEDMVAEETRAIMGLDAAVDVGVGSAVFELVYGTAGADDNQLGFGAGLVNGAFVQDLTLGLTTAWTLNLDADDEDSPQAGDPEFQYNVALQAGYAGLASADFVLVGMDGSEVNSLGIGLGLSPVDFASVQLGFGLGLDDDLYDDAFNSFDASVQLAMGAATARFGYFWLADDAPEVIVPAEYARSNAFSGIYARVKLAY